MGGDVQERQPEGAVNSIMGKKGKPRGAPSAKHAAVKSGGPATFSGTSYQCRYAILEVLNAIQAFLQNPLTDRAIRMEPLDATAGRIERWDVGTSPLQAFYEVKLKPSRQDMLDWFARICSSPSQSAEFVLVYGNGGGLLLTAFEKLKNLATPGCTKEQFQLLVKEYQIKAASEVLEALGEDHFKALQKSRLELLPENVLRRVVSLHSEFLAGSNAQALTDILFRKLTDCAIARGAITISSLLNEISNHGIQLNSHPAVEADKHPASIVEILFALQHCRLPVPLEVIADFLRLSTTEARTQLSSTGQHAVKMDDDACTINCTIPRLTISDGSAVLAKVLTFVLDFIRRHRATDVAKQQSYNALELARVCISAHPESVLPLFDALEKPLKKVGNKRLVLVAAELTIAAAKSKLPREEDCVRAVAKAIICGRSWVYQRVNQLADAEHSAEESLDLGKRIRWDRNTAYCFKCIGRLLRLRGEDENAPANRLQLFEQSAEQLRDAIQAFEALPEAEKIGPDDIGDCHSLLARTFLSGGQLKLAEREAKAARELIQDTTSKDYMDLCILTGDIEARRENHSGAIEDYQRVIVSADNDDAEKSEIVARAYFHLGLSQSTLRQDAGAGLSFRKAADIWEFLGEVEAAAKAIWNLSLLGDPLAKNIEPYLRDETYFVRNATLASYGASLAGIGTGTPKRATVPKKYIEKLISEARRSEATRVPHW
jgi:hypothetical protein